MLKPFDLYTQRAADMFGVPANKVTKEQRRIAKASMYAEAYFKPEIKPTYNLQPKLIVLATHWAVGEMYVSKIYAPVYTFGRAR